MDGDIQHVCMRGSTLQALRSPQRKMTHGTTQHHRGPMNEHQTTNKPHHLERNNQKRRQSSSSSFSPITCIGSSVRTREYHAPRDALGVAVSSIAPGACARARAPPSFIICGASDALRPDVAYSVIRKTMCVYSKNAMLCGRAVAQNMQKRKRKRGVAVRPH